MVLLAGAAWWVAHPTELSELGEVSLPSAEIGKPFLLGVFPDNQDNLRLRGVSPRVTTNTAAADVRLVLCGRPKEVVGSFYARAEDACRELLPTAGSTLPADLHEAQLLLEVTPRRPGKVVIDGITVRYRHGLQVGSQVTGGLFSLTAP